VAHPPGHPLALLVGKACALVPLGSVAFRVGLASALAAAAAAAFTALLAARVAARVGEALGAVDERRDAALGAGAGLGFGLCWAAAFQAVRPEVYALNALLVVFAAWAIERASRAFDEGRRRWLYAAALALGLALANHHLLALCFAAPAALVTLARRPFPRLARALGLCALALAVGLLVYLYLPLRAARHPEVDWGAPTTLARFVWTVSARAFQKSLGRAEASTPVAFALAAELGVSAPLALLGAYLLVRLRETRRLGLLLVGGAAAVAAAPALVGFDPANPDAYGYLEPAVAFAACLGAAAPAAILSMVKRPRVARGVALAIACANAALPALGFPVFERARFADADRFASALIDQAPPRAALVSSNFQTVFALWYLRGVEGRRPDVDLLHRHFLSYPGYRDEMLRRAPALAEVMGANDALGLPALAARRPVLLEYDLDLAPDLAARLAPGAAIARLSPAPPDAAALDRAEADAAQAITRLDATLDVREPQTRRALYWRNFLDAARACSVGRRSAGQAALARARALTDGVRDPDLEDLASRCVP
jgi:hypothetical protein